MPAQRQSPVPQSSGPPVLPSSYPPLRILHVVRTFDLSGRSRMIADLCAGLSPTCASTVVCLSDKPGLKPDGVEVIGLDLPPHGFSFRGMLKLARLLRSSRADVIHSHGRGAAAYAAGARLLHRSACMVHTVHRADGDLLSGRNLIRGKMTKAMDHVVAVSCAAADAFAAANSVDGAGISVIHNGIDTARFAMTTETQRTGNRLCSIANLSSDKDPATLLQAFRLVRKERPDASLLLVGDGPRRDEITRMIDAMGLADAVEMPGFRNDVPEILSRADVFVHASHTEGLGIAVLEAMAAGVPVVATGVGGLMEIIEDGVTGLLVEPRNPEALTEALLHLLSNADLRCHLADAARERASANFSLESMCAKYRALYSKVCE